MDNKQPQQEEKQNAPVFYPTMSRIVWWFSGIGAVIPIILQVIFRLSLYFSPTEVPISRLLWPYVWPSYFILGGLANPDTSGLTIAIIFGMSVLLNALLYAIVGLVVASVRHSVFRK